MKKILEYIEYIKNHKNSTGELSPWVIKNHKTNKIVSSHKSKKDAEKHLQQMHIYSESDGITYSIKLKKLKEERLRVSNIKVGFKKIIPEGINYVDSHSAITPFGTRWGRGLLFIYNGRLDSIICSFGGQHSELKKSLQGKGQTAGTYYWGYEPKTKTVYLEYGSDKTFDFENPKYLNVIMDTLKDSKGPLKDFILQQ